MRFGAAFQRVWIVAFGGAARGTGFGSGLAGGIALAKASEAIEESVLFLKKKNPKRFHSLVITITNESLFASFSSEKEVLACLNDASLESRAHSAPADTSPAGTDRSTHSVPGSDQLRHPAADARCVLHPVPAEAGHVQQVTAPPDGRRRRRYGRTDACHNSRPSRRSAAVRQRPARARPGLGQSRSLKDVLVDLERGLIGVVLVRARGRSRTHSREPSGRTQMPVGSISRGKSVSAARQTKVNTMRRRGRMGSVERPPWRRSLAAQAPAALMT